MGGQPHGHNKDRFTQFSRQELRDCSYPTLTVEEWAHFMGLGRTSAYAMAKNDEIAGLLRLGHKYRISTAATLMTLGEGQ